MSSLVYYYQSKNQKENPNNYKYEILSLHDNRIKAVDEEIYLHELYDVGINNEYINGAKQTSNKFDTSGKMTAKDKDGNIYHINVDDPRYLSGELVGNRKNIL